MWYKKLKDPKPQKVIDLKDIIGVAAVEKDEAGTSYAFCGTSCVQLTQKKKDMNNIERVFFFFFLIID